MLNYLKLLSFLQIFYLGKCDFYLWVFGPWLSCHLIHEKANVRTNRRLIAWLHRVIHNLWGIKQYIILVICITNIKARKKPMKLIHIENLHRSVIFPTFDSDNAISREATMNETIALQLSEVLGNWIIHGCFINTANFFSF